MNSSSKVALIVAILALLTISILFISGKWTEKMDNRWMMGSEKAI